jgi:hypothetical protein
MSGCYANRPAQKSTSKGDTFQRNTAGARIAMNDAGTVRYLLGDHLGSTTITADTSGNRVAERFGI